MRRIAWGGVAPLLCLLPTMGFALALGSISVRSSLNEPFVADIKLSSVRGGELQNARIKMASQDDFKRAGIVYVDVLRDLRFNISRRGGKPVLAITSVAPIREPFLDFLVEVETRQGRMVRQYTVLVDPPELPPGFSPPPPVAAPAVSPRSSGTIRQVPVSRRSPGRTSSRSSGAGRRSAAASAGAYGPTRRNDTLWNIARDNRPSKSVSMNQMMMALLRANPQAFRNNNVNQLKSGAMLAIPKQGEITQLSREEAKNAFQQQYKDWKSGVVSAPPPKVERQVVSDAVRADVANIKAPPAATDSGELVLVAPRPEDENLPEATTDSVGAVAEGGDSTEGMAGGEPEGIDELRHQRDLAQEEAHTAIQKSQELVRRTDELEQRLQEVEQALSIRDADLAAMQAKVALAEAEAAQGAGEDADTEEAAMPADVAGPDDTAVGDIDTPADVDPVPQSEPDAMQSVMDMANEHPERIGAVLGLLGLGGLGVFLTRRRKHALEGDAVAHEAQADAEMPKVTGGDVITAVNQYLAYGRPQEAEERLKQAIIADPERIELSTKLLEVYSRTGNKEAFDALAGEVFVKMGKNTVSADWQRIAGMGRRLSPNNPLYAPIGGNVDGIAAEPPAAPAPVVAPAAAAAVAGGVAAAAFSSPEPAVVEDDGPAFDELEQELRRLELEIGAAVAEEGDTQMDAPAEPIADPGAPDRVEPAASPSLATAGDAGDSSGDMDFDLSFDDLDQMGGKEDTVLESAGSSDDDSLEFDWGSDDSKDDGGEVALDIPDVTGSTDGGDFSDMDLSFDSDGSSANSKVVRGGPPAAGDTGSLSFEESPIADDSLSFDADDSATDLGTDGVNAAAGAPEEEAIIDLGSFGGDDLEMDSADGSGVDIEELTTKLDLARAYVDMDDKESAIDILDEVLKDASGTIRSEAEALRNQLG